MDRTELLADWVEQPPAPPIVQYLRDAERVAAVDLLDDRHTSPLRDGIGSDEGRDGDTEHVLDLASEANVTRSLSADRLTRVDFAPSASERARETLGDTVDEYETVAYDEPRLPFADDSVDGAISVGPYDWRFLDRAQLTTEVHRVLEPGGRLVVTVPTPRSPYAANARNRLRYDTPESAERLFGPEWHRTTETPVYQLPDRPHTFVVRLPDRLQRPFVEFSHRMTDRLAAHGDLGSASYLVLAGDAVDYGRYADAAVDALFRPVADDGFFDPDAGRIVRGLSYEYEEDAGSPESGAGFSWTRLGDHQWRYPPMALLGLLQWRLSPLGTTAYDDRLRRVLRTVEDRLDGVSLADVPSYGLGPLIAAFTLASEPLDDSFTEIARELTDHTTERIEFDHAEDSLVLYGWTYQYEQTGSTALRERIEDALWTVVERQNPETALFEFENPTTHWHQNQQYTLWGLCRAIEVTGLDGYLENAARVLDYTVENRLRPDGALLWDDPDTSDRLRYWTRRRLGRTDGPPHWDLLFACHQTFFVNAVAHYRAAGGEQSYTTAARRAVDWLFGRNPSGKNLVELSGIGVPIRQMTTDGRLDTPGQQFKGTYEVGAYLMALQNLCEW